uniref:NAD(P)/FAD-dependent oxidoreductase n=1 Tax=Collinsella tanakaei TaxID=626935 RepID=UPI00265D4276
MRHYDIVIVGAGITGCAIARHLSRYDLAIACVEAGNDIALGSTKANGGLVHAGYDPAAGTVKASVNARGCALYGRWAKELGFGFKRTGSMVLGFSPADREHLEKLLENGRANGVEDMRIIEDDEIWEHEPRASKEATCALWCPSTGYVDPFEVAIAAAENAAANGVEFWRSAAVDAIDEHADGFVLHTSAGDLSASYLVNAAGNGCTDISRMAGGEHFELVWRQGNIAVLDHEARPLMPLYPIPTSVSKGVIVTGTVHGNTVITATAAIREAGDNDTYAADVEELLSGARKLVPDLDTRRLVRAFAGGRA